MKLRGIDFGPVWGASGVQGFFGEGYPHHKWLRAFFGLDFSGMTFVAKTTTLTARKGNMPLREDGITPREWRPRCIVVKPFAGVVLNSVGLSGPGAQVLLADGRWQQRTEPFFLSFMSVAATARERLAELCAFTEMLGSQLASFRGPVGLQLNFSCPNVGLHSEDLIGEVAAALDAAAVLNIPLVVKLAVTIPPQVALVLASHPSCDALCVSNTVPWGTFPERIDWEGLFGAEESPLKDIGGGGLSGAPLLPLVIEWVSAARLQGCPKPINAGGGLLKPVEVQRLFAVGADSVFIGSMAIVRPWNVQPSIRAAHKTAALRRKKNEADSHPSS